MRALILAAYGFALAAAAYSEPTHDQDVILPPLVDNTSLPERLLMFIPGALVPNHHYTPMLQAIQNATTDIRLTIVMPAVFQRLCIITCLAGKSWACPLKGKLDKLAKKAGFEVTNPKEQVFVAGHSLGATCANYMVQGHDFEYAGLMEFGGYVDMSGPASVAEFSIPVLHMAGELDGGAARPGKLSWFYQQFLDFAESTSTELALKRKPVHVLEGMDHSDFCPGFFVTKVKDIVSEVTPEVALRRIGRGASAFLHLNTERVSSYTQMGAHVIMKDMLNFTHSMCAPYIEAFAYEKSSGAGPWCTEAQKIIVGLSVADADKFDVVEGGCHFVEGSLHDFEHWHTNYTVTPGGGMTVSCGASKENASNFLNTGSQVAAEALDCKLVDATRVAQRLNVTTNLSVECADVNRAAVALAESLLPEKTRKRYQEKGRKYCFKEDTHVFSNIGPLWVQSKFQQEETAECMEVTSSKLISTVDSPIFPGNHYCKLLSPALALDWMYSDSHKPFPYPEATSSPSEMSTHFALIGDNCIQATVIENMVPHIAQAMNMQQGDCASQGYSEQGREYSTSIQHVSDIVTRVFKRSSAFLVV